MKRQTLAAFLCAITFNQLIHETSGYVDAGIRVTAAENIIQEINRIEVAEMESKIRSEGFPNSSGKKGSYKWKLRNTRVTSMSSLVTNIDLRDGNRITYSGSISSVTVRSDYFAQKTVLFFVPVWSDGRVDADFRRLSLSLTVRLSVVGGKLVIAMDRCSASIGDVDLDFSKSFVSWIMNMISGLFEDTIEDKLEDATCDILEEKLSELSQDMTNMKTLYDIKVIGIPMVLDSSFADIEISHDDICVYNKEPQRNRNATANLVNLIRTSTGEFIWQHRRFSPKDSGAAFLPKTEQGLGFDLKTDAANNLLKAVTESGGLDGELAYKELKERGLDFLSLHCEHVCIGNAFKTVSEQYPDSVLGMHWKVTYGGLEVKDNEIFGRLVGRVFFKAENESNAVYLFSASMNLTAHFQVRFSDNNTLSKTELNIQAVGLGGQIVIDESMIGKVLSDNVQHLLEQFILPVLRDELLKLINDYETDYILPLPARTRFKDASIMLYPGVIRVETDICYKQACEFIGTGAWVGKYTSDHFDVQDVIPTTPAPPTTTTTTTPAPIRTPPPKSQHRGAEQPASCQQKQTSEFILLLCAFILAQF